MNLQRPATQMSRPYSRASSRCSTPMVNAEPAERRLKDKVFRHWKDIQRQCRNLDTGNTGTISVSEFSGQFCPCFLHLLEVNDASIRTRLVLCSCAVCFLGLALRIRAISYWTRMGIYLWIQLFLWKWGLGEHENCHIKRGWEFICGFNYFCGNEVWSSMKTKI